MTVEEVIRSLQADAKIPSRFPVRLIFTESLNEYNKLVEQLRKITEKNTIINIGDCCVGDDKYPVQAKLDEKIVAFGETSITLLSISEYLRICIEREFGSQKLFLPLWEMQQSENSRRRIIIPLFSARELFDRLVERLDPRQADYIYTIEGTTKRYDLMFCAPCFTNIFRDAINGIRPWLLSWNKLLMEKPMYRIITVHYDKIQKSASSVYVDRQEDVFLYLKRISKNDALLREWGTEERWALLAKAHSGAVELNSTIDKQLHVLEFIPLKILSQWKTMSDNDKWLAWLRFKLADLKGYIAYVFKLAKNITTIEKELRFSIFDLFNEHPAWIDEYRMAMQVLNLSATSEFISKLSAIDSLEIRLAMLTCNNHEEKTYAIKIAGELIRNGETLDEIAMKFAVLYPAFKEYLNSPAMLSTELRHYFSWYIRKKIENYFENKSDLVSSINLEKYVSRNSIISNILPADDAFLFWFDGMGIEWLPLFLSFVNKELYDATCEKFECSARIPTETIYNEQWTQYKPLAEKRDKLDKLSHHGLPDDNDYFSCIATQIEIIRDFAQIAVAKLSDFNTVIISADHGSSRLAARAFHELPGITTQGGGIIKNHGRYCEYSYLPDMMIKPTCADYESREVDGIKKHFFVMTTHDHFVQKGRAVDSSNDGEVGCGEIHGGKTPEEFLVPVIVLRRKNPIVTTTTKKKGLMRNTSGDIL